MKLNRRNSQKAFTRTEVIIIIVALTAFALLLVPAVKITRDKVRLKICKNNLIQFSVADRQWLTDNGSRYPMSLSTNVGGTQEYIATGEVFRHLQVMSNVMKTPKNLVCPSDVRNPAKDFIALSNTNVSYFVGLDLEEERIYMFRAGDRNLTNGVPLPPNRIMELTSNSVVGWTAEMHNRQGNIAMSDGSVQSWSDRRLREGLANSGVATNRLAMP